MVENDTDRDRDGSALIETLKTSRAVAPADDTDALVRRAQAGDLEAFERLYRRHTGRVFALCLRMSGDERRAEELAQDAWVRVWERLGTFRGESAFTTWLHRLTVNLILHEKRTEGRRRARIELTEDPAAVGGEVRQRPTETRLELERAVAELPDGARQVFLLYDVEGYKHREIAEMTGTAVGTVKAQLHRARKLLREMLER